MIKDVGQLIRKVRLEAGLSQDQLSEMLDVRRSNISQYEHKGVCPNVYRFEDILNVCGYEIVIRKKDQI